MVLSWIQTDHLAWVDNYARLGFDNEIQHSVALMIPHHCFEHCRLACVRNSYALFGFKSNLSPKSILDESVVRYSDASVSLAILTSPLALHILCLGVSLRYEL
jgi:hypothetical protein